jgi:hypothetical protein
MKGNAARCGKKTCHWTSNGLCVFDPPCFVTNPDDSYEKSEPSYASIEYEIFWKNYDDPEPHRVFTEPYEAEEWISEWEEDGGRADIFTIRWRGIGSWQDQT